MSPDNLSVLDFSTIRCGEVLKVLLKNTVMRYQCDYTHLGMPKTRMDIGVKSIPSPRTYTYNSIKKIFIYKQVGKWVYQSIPVHFFRKTSFFRTQTP